MVLVSPAFIDDSNVGTAHPSGFERVFEPDVQGGVGVKNELRPIFELGKGLIFLVLTSSNLSCK